jgi:hypothetical protein
VQAFSRSEDKEFRAEFRLDAKRASCPATGIVRLWQNPKGSTHGQEKQGISRLIQKRMVDGKRFKGYTLGKPTVVGGSSNRKLVSWRVAQAFDFAGTTTKMGVPSFAHVAKGGYDAACGAGFDYDEIS